MLVTDLRLSTTETGRYISVAFRLGPHMHIGYTYKYRRRRGRENDDKNPVRINQSLTFLSKPITDLRNESSDERHHDHPEVKENHDDTIRPKRSAASAAKVSDRTTSH